MSKVRNGLIGGPGLLFVICATPALAQTTPSTGAQDEAAAPDQTPVPVEAQEDNDRIAYIVVTGRKRASSEALQSVPISITALGAAQLSTPIITNLLDVGRLTPNASLQTSSQRGIQNFAIRGMGISGSTPPGDFAQAASRCAVRL